MSNFTIYKSSAGSGKTYTLVREYLRIVLQNPFDYRHTLAITFTNKATAEMKSRILKALVELSENRNQNLADDLKKELPDIDIKKNAAFILKNILHRYSDLSVSTIDSFFVRIIKSLSRELGLPGKYDVEINKDAAVDSMILSLMDAVGEQNEITNWLEDFVQTKLDDEKGWRIENELKKIAEEIFKERYQELRNTHGGKITKETLGEIKQIRYAFENKMQDFGKQFLKIVDANNLDIKDFYYGSSGFVKYIFRLAGKVSPMDYKPKPRFIEAVQDENARFSKNSSAAKNISANDLNEVDSILNGINSLLEKDFKKYITAAEILNLIYVAGITSYLEEQLKKYRDENNLFMLSDAGKFLNEVISLNDTPFIYEKTGNRYKHFLIDEFQDTSLVQWKNIFPLVENSLASGNHVLTVGDVKQSIYRWRGGDMSLLLEKLENDLQHFQTSETVKSLNTNFRSLKEIVHFNNLFFSELIQWSSRSDNYNFPLLKQAFDSKNLIQDVARKDGVGFVSVKILDANEKETEIKFRDEVTGWKRNALAELLMTIKNLQQLKYKLCDISILVRRNKDGNMVSGFLMDNGYKKIISPDSLLIKNAAQINFLVNCFRFISDSSNQVAQNAIRYFYFKNLSTQTISAEKIFSDSPDEEVLNHFFKHSSYYKKFNLYELTEMLVNNFFGEEKNDIYIIRFLDLVKESSDSESSSLSEFLKWWDNEREAENISVITPAEDDAINIVTIHKSKGLQFPVVIMPLFDWNMFPKSDSTMWVCSDESPFSKLGSIPVNSRKALEETFFADEFEKECELSVLENVNMMYVAFTRAEEKLYVFAPDKPKDGEKSCASILKSLMNESAELKNALSISENNFSLGEELPAKRKEKSDSDNFENPQTVELSKIFHPFNRKKIGFKLKKYESEEQEELIETGIAVHQLLSEFILATDVNTITEKLKSKKYYEKISDLVGYGMQIITEEKWTKEFYEIKTECELVSSEGEIFRPDRLMYKDGKAIVVDYKTGKQDLKHTAQLNSYEKVLLQVGFTEVEKYLIYLSAKEIVEITS